MFKRIFRGIEHTFTLFISLPRPSHRRLLQHMVAFSRRLPRQFEQPLPAMMANLTPRHPKKSSTISPNQMRQMADAVAAWHLLSPLGICLRRSLIRYHFLHSIGYPVQIVFGARLKDAKEGGGIGGHAWLLYDGQPYYENPKDYEGFVKMYVYPDKSTTE
ncbi:MAG: lasso peptide biosynthesis B2 protein [Chloroflexota bacterium]